MKSPKRAATRSVTIITLGRETFKDNGDQSWSTPMYGVIGKLNDRDLTVAGYWTPDRREFVVSRKQYSAEVNDREIDLLAHFLQTWCVKNKPVTKGERNVPYLIG